MKQIWECQPRPTKSASASLTIAWIFSAVMPGGRAGSEKSTVVGSKPINRTRFIQPPRMPSLAQSPQVLAAVNSRALQRIHHFHTTYFRGVLGMVGDTEVERFNFVVGRRR